MIIPQLIYIKRFKQTSLFITASFILIFQVYGTCWTLSKNRLLCISYFPNKFIQQIEIFDGTTRAPLQAIYFHQNLRPMVYKDWESKFYIHWNDSGTLIERQVKNEYRMYLNGEEEQVCSGTECYSNSLDVIKIDHTKLHAGDLLFSSDLNPYSSSNSTLFRHVSLVLGKEYNKTILLSSNIDSPPSVHPIESVLVNPIRYSVIRNPILKEYLLNKLKTNKVKNSIRRAHPFCTLFFVELLLDLIPEIKSWRIAEKIFPEYLFWKLSEKFGINHSIPKLTFTFRQREPVLKQQELEWSWIMSKPKLSFYRMFKSEYAFLPLDYSRSTLESLLMQTDSGLFDGLQLSDREKEMSHHEFLKFHGLKALKTKQPSLKPSQNCFPKKSSERICILESENRTTEGIEIFDQNNVAPSFAFYFNPDGKLHTFVSHKLKTFLGFDQNNKLEEEKKQQNYWHRNGTKCISNLCKTSQKAKKIPTHKMKFGDVVFTGSVFDYSGRQKLALTHVSFYLGEASKLDSWIKNIKTFKQISKKKKYLLNNDIAKPMEIIPVKELETNLIRYVVLRNPSFSEKLKNFLSNKKKLGVPHFCANLYAQILDEVWPSITSDWDQIDRNHTETIFYNTWDKFNVIDFDLGKFKLVQSFIDSREEYLQNLKPSIQYILSDRNKIRMRLFEKRFELLPIVFDKSFQNSLDKVLSANSPLQLQTNTSP